MKFIKNRGDSYPLVTSYCFFRGPSANFITPGKILTIEKIDRNLLSSLLKLCNGYISYNNIVVKLKRDGHDVKTLNNLIKTFMQHKIIVNAYEYYQLFHLYSSIPLIFWKENTPEDLNKMIKSSSPLAKPPSKLNTHLELLLQNRTSFRQYKHKFINKNQICSLVWATYGKLERSAYFPKSKIGVGTIPSAGGLYSLCLFVFVLNGSSLKRGIYKASPRGLVFQKTINQRLLAKIFVGYTEQIQNVSLIMVISSNFKQATQKYFNRGYRYALLEAGHAAQNAYLWCTEQNLGIVEVGSFKDRELSRILGLQYPDNAPLTSLFVGIK